jgi:hypothetical protein
MPCLQSGDTGMDKRESGWGFFRSSRLHFQDVGDLSQYRGFYRSRSRKRSREYEETTSNTKPKLSTDSSPKPSLCTGNTDSRLITIPKIINNAATDVTTGQSGLVTTSLLSGLQPGSVDIVRGDLKQPKILSILTLPEHILASSLSVVFSMEVRKKVNMTWRK